MPPMNSPEGGAGGSPSTEKGAAPNPIPVLSERDLQIAALAFQCFLDQNPKIDMDKFSSVAGYKNAGSAAVMYHNSRRRLVAQRGGLNLGGQTPKKGARAPKSATVTPTPKNGPASGTGAKTPRSTKRKRAEESDEDEDTELFKTPSHKLKMEPKEEYSE